MTNFTLYENPALALVCVQGDSSARFSLEALANLTGVHTELLRYYCRIGLIETVQRGSETEVFFEENALLEVRRIEHYRRFLFVGRQGLPMICALRREAERRHIEIPFLRFP